MPSTPIKQTLRAAALPGAVVLAATVAVAMAAAARPSVSMRGSPASMERQYEVAASRDFTFAESPAAVEKLVSLERLVPVPGGADYTLHQVSYPYARPEVKTFVETLAAEYRRECGEPLVVTSLTRPRSAQPGNAHKLSVHPAGMAVDFRIAGSADCQKWMEKKLLAMERKDLLDATRERNPPHYHVAVFPDAYRAYAARNPPAERPAPPSPTVLPPQPAPPAPSAMPPRAPAAAERGPGIPVAEAPQTGGAVVATLILLGLAAFLWSMSRRARRPR